MKEGKGRTWGEWGYTGVYMLIKWVLCRLFGCLVDHSLPCRGKLAQLVAHHVLGDGHWQVVLPVVDLEGDPNELGQDCGSPGHGLHCGGALLSIDGIFAGHPFVLGQSCL